MIDKQPVPGGPNASYAPNPAEYDEAYHSCGVEWVEIMEEADLPHDPVNHPKHYTDHPSGVECIQIAERMSFCAGNVIKYVWRAGLKGDELEDLKKARFYLDREIARLENKNERAGHEQTGQGQEAGQGAGRFRGDGRTGPGPQAQEAGA